LSLTATIYLWDARLLARYPLGGERGPVPADITKWFGRDVWTRAVNDTGYTVTRR
jgi:hypothetical protein